MDLTQKELEFIENVLMGMSKTDAYIMAYKPKTENIKSIHNMAYTVWKRQRVRNYYNAKVGLMINNEYPVQQQLNDLIYEIEFLRAKTDKDYKDIDTIRKLIETYNNLAEKLHGSDTENSRLKSMFMSIHSKIANKKVD